MRIWASFKHTRCSCQMISDQSHLWCCSLLVMLFQLHECYSYHHYHFGDQHQADGLNSVQTGDKRRYFLRFSAANVMIFYSSFSSRVWATCVKNCEPENLPPGNYGPSLPTRAVHTTWKGLIHSCWSERLIWVNDKLVRDRFDTISMKLSSSKERVKRIYSHSSFAYFTTKINPILQSKLDGCK